MADRQGRAVGAKEDDGLGAAVELAGEEGRHASAEIAVALRRQRETRGDDAGEEIVRGRRGKSQDAPGLDARQ